MTNKNLVGSDMNLDGRVASEIEKMVDHMAKINKALDGKVEDEQESIHHMMSPPDWYWARQKRKGGQGHYYDLVEKYQGVVEEEILIAYEP